MLKIAKPSGVLNLTTSFNTRANIPLYPYESFLDNPSKLARAVKELVDSQARFPDWNKRDDIKSALKVGLILLLDEFGYPPVERDEVYVEIFEQPKISKRMI